LSTSIKVPWCWKMLAMLTTMASENWVNQCKSSIVPLKRQLWSIQQNMEKIMEKSNCCKWCVLSYHFRSTSNAFHHGQRVGRGGKERIGQFIGTLRVYFPDQIV
jgi:hypothetical protein